MEDCPQFHPDFYGTALPWARATLPNPIGNRGTPGSQAHDPNCEIADGAKVQPFR